MPFAVLTLLALKYFPAQALLRVYPAFEPHLPLALAFAAFLLPIPFLALTLNHLKRQLGILTSGLEDICLLFPICLILYGITFFILYVIVIKDIPFFLPIW